MNVVHFVPVGEEELHEPHPDCVCRPKRIPMMHWMECDLDAEAAWEHFAFSPIANTADYSVENEV